jgi:lipoyl(octanoyl) transferase
MLRSDISTSLFSSAQVEWEFSPGLTGYPEAERIMNSRIIGIAEGSQREAVWLLEHPPIYTKGTSAHPTELLQPDRFPVYGTGRGGRYTYHGPGQRIAYVMLNLRSRGHDVRAFVSNLETWLIQTLLAFGIAGERREDKVGVWVKKNGSDYKIAALGIRISRGVTFHGISLNVDPDLSHFDGIVPCGVTDGGVTSFKDLGLTVTMQEVDAVLKRVFEALFGPAVSIGQ